MGGSRINLFPPPAPYCFGFFLLFSSSQPLTLFHGRSEVFITSDLKSVSELSLYE